VERKKEKTKKNQRLLMQFSICKMTLKVPSKKEKQIEKKGRSRGLLKTGPMLKEKDF